MRNTSHRLASVFTMILVFAMVVFVATMRQSAANQNAPGERYEYRVLKEHPLGEKLNSSRTRDPFGRLEPPKELEEFINKLARDGWEIENLRLRNAQSELRANREGPGYYLYSDAGENGPRFLRLRRRID